nr:copia protein [Tanacetum cinerariifolium]
MSYLTDYEEIDDGYVSFGGNLKGRKITGKDHLGKFDGKDDEGFFVGYLLSSKAFRVFNSRTKIVEEDLHIRFSENIPNVVDPKSSQDDGFQPSSDIGKKVDEDPSKGSECRDQEQDYNVNSTNKVNAASINRVNVIRKNISNELPFDPNMPTLEDIDTFNFSSDHEYDDEEADINNIDTTIQFSLIPTTRIHKDHPLDQMDVRSAFLYEKIEEEVYVCQPPGFEDPEFLDKVYKVEKALYGLHRAPKAW